MALTQNQSTLVSAVPVASWDAPTERRRRKGNRFSRAVKEAATTLYKWADNVASAETRACTCSQCNSNRFDGMLPEPPSAQEATQQRSTAERLEQRIRRAQRQRGRPLTAEEHQSVINQFQMGESLGDAFKHIGSDEEY
eukprot:CAMPEP_0172831832 /NCGR_PEP_ID=MMETSP1075-20121228/23241_1 /TAXON_ID=2916 /ORGANISM="Ceratium fusus, Strain PA161109" /LENGTH=138 /DNA_ID=CAMNT_0013674351 /DNA_START=20 /DNA_END=433 /DNA_ORIENTATION=-